MHFDRVKCIKGKTPLPPGVSPELLSPIVHRPMECLKMRTEKWFKLSWQLTSLLSTGFKIPCCTLFLLATKAQVSIICGILVVTSWNWQIRGNFQVTLGCWQAPWPPWLLGKQSLWENNVLGTTKSCFSSFQKILSLAGVTSVLKSHITSREWLWISYYQIIDNFLYEMTSAVILKTSNLLSISFQNLMSTR